MLKAFDIVRYVVAKATIKNQCSESDSKSRMGADGDGAATSSTESVMFVILIMLF